MWVIGGWNTTRSVGGFRGRRPEAPKVPTYKVPTYVPGKRSEPAWWRDSDSYLRPALLAQALQDQEPFLPKFLPSSRGGALAHAPQELETVTKP